MNERLQRIEEELADELRLADTALGELETRRVALVSQRDKLAATLAKLRGEAATAKSPIKRGQPRQPCATKDEVAELVTRVLRENGPCSEEDLIDLVEDSLKAAGKSRSGFKLRYQGVRRELLTTTSDGLLTLVGPLNAHPGRA